MAGARRRPGYGNGAICFFQVHNAQVQPGYFVPWSRVAVERSRVIFWVHLSGVFVVSKLTRNTNPIDAV